MIILQRTKDKKRFRKYDTITNTVTMSTSSLFMVLLLPCKFRPNTTYDYDTIYQSKNGNFTALKNSHPEFFI